MAIFRLPKMLSWRNQKMFGLRSLSTPVHRLSREERAVEEKFQAKLARSGDLNAFLRSLDEGCALRWRSSTLATAWHRLAKHGGRSQRAREAVRTLAARSQRLTARAARPREIANIVWAWGAREAQHESRRTFFAASGWRSPSDPRQVAVS